MSPDSSPPPPQAAPPRPVSLDDTLELMHDLRRRCEWDAAQTHESLRPYLIEEAHELDEALRDANDPLIREELGDVLLQVLFHSVVAEERGAFTFADVAGSLIAKMKHRHPHLYGDGVRIPWETMKSKKRESIAEGLPTNLPSLHRAHRLQDRAAGVGFDWPNWHGPAEKVREELTETEELLQSTNTDHSRVEEELGDLLFSVVNLCRKVGVHASLALDKANAKFQHRFEAIERLAKERGITMGDASLETLDQLWDEIK